jgi:hypothetical protein
MDRKKIKMLVALHGWRIRCRATYQLNPEYQHGAIGNEPFIDVQYAWLENSEGKHYHSYDFSEQYPLCFGKTRTQAINNLLDYWYEVNKHTLEK